MYGSITIPKNTSANIYCTRQCGKRDLRRRESMRKAWVRKPKNYFVKVEWRQFYGIDGKWWLDKRFYFQDGKLPEHYAEEIAECEANPDLFDDGIKHSLSARHTHGIILCTCGRKVDLISHWANPCTCGTEYGDDGAIAFLKKSELNKE